MRESTLIVLLLVLLFAIVLAAIAFVLRTLQSQHTLASVPSAQLASGLNSVHSEQARLAQELGRAAIGVAALPDAVYQLCRLPHAKAFRRGVILVPYSMAVPGVEARPHRAERRVHPCLTFPPVIHIVASMNASRRRIAGRLD